MCASTHKAALQWEEKLHQLVISELYTNKVMQPAIFLMENGGFQKKGRILGISDKHFISGIITKQLVRRLPRGLGRTQSEKADSNM